MDGPRSGRGRRIVGRGRSEPPPGLFGTFEPEKERPDYGLTTNISTYNPLRIAFHEWAAIGRDVRSARSLREALGFIFGPPGWRPDTVEDTAPARRARALAAQAERAPEGA